MIKVPMLFPGQGSQAVGMTADLMDRSGSAADFLNSVNGVLNTNLLEIMHDGPGELLTETKNAQPAILAHSVAVTLALRDMGIVPAVVAGHSVGEFSAGVAAGVFTPTDALKVVRRRGELMFAAGQDIPGTMAAVLGLNHAQVTDVCAQITKDVGVVVIANHNSEVQIVISGEIEAVAAASEALRAVGVRRVVPLNVSGAFHSPLLDDAGRQFIDFLKGISFKDAAVPFISTVLAKQVSGSSNLTSVFGSQLTAPVLWHDTLDMLVNQGPNRPKIVLEIGPGKVLSNLARRANPGVKFVPVGTAGDLDGIMDILKEFNHGELESSEEA